MFVTCILSISLTILKLVTVTLLKTEDRRPNTEDQEGVEDSTIVALLPSIISRAYISFSYHIS
jgi:hypothetical protein